MVSPRTARAPQLPGARPGQVGLEGSPRCLQSSSGLCFMCLTTRTVPLTYSFSCAVTATWCPVSRCLTLHAVFCEAWPGTLGAQKVSPEYSPTRTGMHIHHIQQANVYLFHALRAEVWGGQGQLWH